jgi:hypothetical protein
LTFVPAKYVVVISARAGFRLPARRCGAVDQNIDAPERRQHGGHHGLDGRIVAGVGPKAAHPAAGHARKLRGGGFERGRIARHERDARAFAGELARHRLADAAASAGDDGNLVFELQVQGVSFPH